MARRRTTRDGMVEHAIRCLSHTPTRSLTTPTSTTCSATSSSPCSSSLAQHQHPQLHAVQPRPTHAHAPSFFPIARSFPLTNILCVCSTVRRGCTTAFSQLPARARSRAPRNRRVEQNSGAKPASNAPLIAPSFPTPRAQSQSTRAMPPFSIMRHEAHSHEDLCENPFGDM